MKVLCGCRLCRLAFTATFETVDDVCPSCKRMLSSGLSVVCDCGNDHRYQVYLPDEYAVRLKFALLSPTGCSNEDVLMVLARSGERLLVHDV
jgi:hypothetical protein